MKYTHSIILNNVRHVKEYHNQNPEFKIPIFFSPSFHSFQTDIEKPTIQEIREACGGLDCWNDEEIRLWMTVEKMDEP